ncbi:metalloregulator ArsR/SmtB family transcription factor [Pseudaeromonas paramecii]|uniref:HTH arsR-type domain-containing protein n=1 Tax=Pseudaeromonas paramecii TaxID=2138166 RepID=A0ABP8QL54_9GAMM
MSQSRVLFLCTANSARSILAEALLRQLAGDRFAVYSAGSRPESVDPRALTVLGQAGIGTEGLVSKGLDAVSDQRFDFVISLCDKASLECQQIPHKGRVLHWNLPDPKAEPGEAPFVACLQAIRSRIELFLQVVGSDPLPSSRELAPAELFRALADETRLRLMLLLLQEGELCVCELTEALDDLQPKISRHLKQLRHAGLVQDRRQGQWIFYRLDDSLPSWADSVLRLAAQALPGPQHGDLRRLAAMQNRPSREGVCGLSNLSKESA